MELASITRMSEPGTDQPLFGNPETWPTGFVTTPIQDELPSVGTFINYATFEFPRPNGRYKIYTGDSNGYLIGTTSVKTDYDPVSTEFDETPFTPPLYYQTDDSAGVSVSNYATTFGQITLHINSDVQSIVDYYTLGYDESNDIYPKSFHGTTTFQEAAPSITTSQLQILPRNVALTVPGTSGTTTETQQFLSLAFLTDKTVQDKTAQVTWSVVDADTGQAPVGAVFSTQQPGLLEMTNVPNASVNLTVTATINTAGNPSFVGTDTTSVRVAH